MQTEVCGLQKFLKECLQAGGPYVQEDFMWQVVSCANIVDAMWKGGVWHLQELYFSEAFFENNRKILLEQETFFQKAAVGNYFFSFSEFPEPFIL